jgi:hypothetical protein
MGRKAKLFGSLAALGILCALPAAARAAPMDPIVQLVSSELDRHPLVGVGDNHHGGEEAHLLRMALIRDPDVLCKVDAIAVEFGNSALQGIADRYVAGGEVSPGELNSIWRDTGQWMVWDSPVYRQFFEAVREANLRQICPKPVRVLLADPPIDWSKVKTAAQYRPYRVRDRFFADIVEGEILQKKRRALVFAGDSHLWKDLPGASAEPPRFAQIVAKDFPGAIFSITFLPDPERDAGLPPPPSVTRIRGTALGKRPFETLMAADDTIDMNVDGKVVERPVNAVPWPAAEQVVDAFVNLGPSHYVEPDPAIYRDPVYQAELRRRAVILKEVHGLDFLGMLEEQLARP